MIWIFLIFVFSFDEYWCEPPLLEYPERTGSDLIMVQILTRHGARTPLHQSILYPHVWQCNNTEFVMKSHHPHSTNNPLHIHVSQSKSIFLGNCHYGQLLGKGSDALRRLGQHIRKFYVDQLKFLPTIFNENIIKFRSTRTHRTLHSQMNFVSGLYPNLIGRSTNITIVAPDKAIDPLRHLPAVCTNLKKVVDEITQSDEFRSKFEERQIIFKQIGKVFGTKGKSTTDIIMAARCNKIENSIPFTPKNSSNPTGFFSKLFKSPHNNDANSNNEFQFYDIDDTNQPEIEITDETLDSAALLKAEQQQYIYSHPKVFPLKFSFAISEMVNLMIERINGESKLRFVHFSGHDGDIFGFLGFLGTGSKTLPPYGSYIISELCKNRNSGEFFVRFIYNGQVLRIPHFGNVKNVPFLDLVRFIKFNMPSIKGDCGFSLEKFKKSWTFQQEEH